MIRKKCPEKDASGSGEGNRFLCVQKGERGGSELYVMEDRDNGERPSYGSARKECSFLATGVRRKVQTWD